MAIIKTIAHKFIQESIKLKIPLIILIFVFSLSLTFSFILKSDGTLKSQIQIVMNYNLFLSALVIYLLTLFLGTWTFTSEIKYKFIYLLDTKPVKRSQIFLGKLLGIIIFNLVILIILSIVNLGIVYYLYYKNNDKKEKEKVKYEVFTPYEKVLPYIDFKRIDYLVEKEFKKLKEKDKLPKNIDVNIIKNKIRNRIIHSSNLIPYGYAKIWNFRNIPYSLTYSKDKKLKLKYKVYTSETTAGFLCKVKFQIGTLYKYNYQDKIKTGELLSFTIPTYVIDKREKVEVRFFHIDKKAGYIYFPIKDGISLYYPSGNFIINYFKGIFLIFIISIFLGILSLFSSTFLGFAVAILLGLYILGIGLIGNFIKEIIPLGTQIIFKEQYPFFQNLYISFLKSIFFIIPNISSYSPIDYICNGLTIKWKVILESLFFLLVIRGGILILLGIIIFKKREIGKPII